MSLSDRWRSMLGKQERKPDPEPAAALTPTPASVPVPPAPATPPSPTLEEVDRLIAQEKVEGQAHLQALEQEIQAIKMALEKSEVSAKNRRDAQQQTLQFLQQDADREIKFLERKL